jgi:hypothetical protein
VTWLKLDSCLLVTRLIPDVSFVVEAFGTGRQEIIPGGEHARWFPKCAHLRQNKGDKFAEAVQEKHTQLDRIIYINLNY